MRSTARLALVCLLPLAACDHSSGSEGPAQPSQAPEAAPTPALEVNAARLVGADHDQDNWLSHGRTYDEQRFSPLTSISTGNVGTLGLAWSLDLDTSRGQEATPLVADGVMYSTSAWSKVQAIDAATGKLLWQYDPKVPGETGVKACCDVVNRGVALWKGRVYVGTLDGRLVALDAKTGKEAWSVVTVDQTKKYTITGAPRIVKGKVLIGNGGAEFGVRGYVSAYDADDGKLAWRFYTVPGDPSQPVEAPILTKAAATWKGEYWKLGGGGTVWDSMAYDPELDLLYIGVGNGSPWNQRLRSPGGGDNLFLSSIVALKAETGEYVWHYQTTPGESWDYTATQHIVLADLTLDGQPRKVLMQAPKNGFFYVLDRTNGKLLSAQPFTTINWASGVDMKTGRPLQNPAAHFGDTHKPWIALPGPLGSHNWQPMSFSPQTHLVYLPVHDVAFAYGDPKTFTPDPLAFNSGIDPSIIAMPEDPKAMAGVLATVHGYLKAWDPVTQKEVWRVEQAGAWNGGVLSTAGGLVFEGNGAGTFNAYSADKGAPLWSFNAQTGIVAAPISYAVGGQQYIAVVVGSGGTFPLAFGEIARKGAIATNRSRVLAFRLGAMAQLPAPPPMPPPAKPPERFGDATKQLPIGKLLFESYCNVCHGDSAVGAGVLPDLRWSPMNVTPELWKSVVLDGKRAQNGMVTFAPVLTPEFAELIRMYVVARANDTYAATLSAMQAPPPPGDAAPSKP
jgi:PQQ-dependent dehydrogenase (methanol/ethanol family)